MYVCGGQSTVFGDDLTDPVAHRLVRLASELEGYTCLVRAGIAGS